jgi:hypothetical protein
MGRLVRFVNNIFFFQFRKRYYNAVVVNSDVVGVAPGDAVQRSSTPPTEQKIVGANPARVIGRNALQCCLS